MLLVANCIDTPYNSAPGRIAISVSIHSRRDLSFEPNTPRRYSRQNCPSCTVTNTISARAAIAFTPSNRG